MSVVRSMEGLEIRLSPCSSITSRRVSYYCRAPGYMPLLANDSTFEEFPKRLETLLSAPREVVVKFRNATVEPMRLLEAPRYVGSDALSPFQPEPWGEWPVRMWRNVTELQRSILVDKPWTFRFMPQYVEPVPSPYVIVLSNAYINFVDVMSCSGVYVGGSGCRNEQGLRRAVHRKAKARGGAHSFRSPVAIFVPNIHRNYYHDMVELIPRVVLGLSVLNAVPGAVLIISHPYPNRLGPTSVVSSPRLWHSAGQDCSIADVVCDTCACAADARPMP